MNLSRRRLLSLSAMAGLSTSLSTSLSGCNAVTAVSRASDPLDAYTLSPLAPVTPRGAGQGHIVVELPSTGGELSSDRILIKVSPLQAQYLPEARWAEPVPAMVQTLLVNSLLNQGRFRLVSRVGAGLQPDHTLMTEIQAFQAELTGVAPEGPLADPLRRMPAQVRVEMQLTVIRESDRAIAGTRRFAGLGAVPSDGTAVLIESLDRIVQSVLAEAVAWTRDVT